METYDGQSTALSVVLPAFNESAVLARVIWQTRAALAELDDDWEILVVDDGSTDDTPSIAATEGVRVIRLPVNSGYGAAVKRGVAASRGPIIALMDADGSYPPQCLPQLLRFVPEYDQVNGARNRESGTWPLLRKPAKWLLKRFAELITGRRIPDLNTGMRVFKREIAMKNLWAVSDGFSCSASLTMAFLCNGHSVKYVSIDYRSRQGHSKFRPLRDGMQYLLTILRMATYFRPLQVFVPMALLLAAMACLRALYHWWTSPTGLADADVFLGVSAVLVLAVGLLADLIVAKGRSP